jgi:hypothetical protein
MLHELAFALTLTKERLISYRPTMCKHRKFNNAVSSYAVILETSFVTECNVLKNGVYEAADNLGLWVENLHT